MRGRRGGERLAAITSKAPVSRKASIGGMVRLLGRWRLLDEVVELARLGAAARQRQEVVPLDKELHRTAKLLGKPRHRLDRRLDLDVAAAGMRPERGAGGGAAEAVERGVRRVGGGERHRERLASGEDWKSG